jgi:K+-sensing histidine kinase KdpD
LRRELTTEDYAMMMQWVAIFVLAPFVLIPLLPMKQVTFASRSILVVGVLLFTSGMTLLYLWARRGSHRRAAVVADLTAAIDILIVFTALVLWPEAIANLFWILTILVMAIAARFSYREAAVAALSFSAFYLIINGIKYGSDMTRPILANALLRVVLMIMVAAATAYVTQREKRWRKEARTVSRIASAIGSTFNVDQLLEAVVNGLSEVSRVGRCTAFLISNDDRWAVPKCTTESDPVLREKLLKGRVNLKRDNWASRAVEQAVPLVVAGTDEEQIIDGGSAQEFGVSKKMALPLIIRNEVKGIIVVERSGIKKYFTDHEAGIYNTIVAQAASGIDNAMRYSEEQQKRSEADTLYRTSRELGSTLDVEEVLENACRLVMRSTGASCCAAFLVDEVRGKLEPRLFAGGGARRTRT